jgi:hypothetical protein
MGLDVHLHIEGVKPADENFNKKLKVLKACHEAGVEAPEEILEFFEVGSTEEYFHENVDDGGVTVKISDRDVLRGIDRKPNVEKGFESCVSSLPEHNYRNGFYIDLEKIPKDIKLLRVFTSNSY